MKRTLDIIQQELTEVNHEHQLKKQQKKKMMVESSFVTVLKYNKFHIEQKQFLEEKGVSSVRFFNDTNLLGCVKLHDKNNECSISLFFGANQMEINGSLTIFVEMLKSFLYENTDVTSLELNISREDYNRKSIDKKLNNSFSVPICPEEWKGSEQYHMSKTLLKMHGFRNDLPFYFPTDFKVNKDYVFC